MALETELKGKKAKIWTHQCCERQSMYVYVVGRKDEGQDVMVQTYSTYTKTKYAHTHPKKIRTLGLQFCDDSHGSIDSRVSGERNAMTKSCPISIPYPVCVLVGMGVSKRPCQTATRSAEQSAINIPISSADTKAFIMRVVPRMGAPTENSSTDSERPQPGMLGAGSRQSFRHSLSIQSGTPRAYM